MNKYIGVLSENHAIDKRAILVPKDVKSLSRFFDIMVEEGTGNGIMINDEEYEEAGATIATKEQIWQKCNLVVKYKAPSTDDYKYFSDKKVFCGLLHPEGNIDLINALNEKKMTSFSFEYFKSIEGTFPMAYAGGQIAGKMAVMYASYFLQSQFGGLGVPLFKVDNSIAPHVAVIGYGHVGGAAINLLLKLGCKVSVFGRHIYKMRKLNRFFDGNIKFYRSTPENYKKILPSVDALIGSILISTDATPPIITTDILKQMKKGATIIDVTCGYGRGYMPNINEKTSLNDPIRKTKYGQIYCKIDNLPSAYPKSTSFAYSNQVKEILPKIYNFCFNQSEESFIKSGMITHNGKITNSSVKEDIKTGRTLKI